MNNGLSSAKICIDKAGPLRGTHAPVIRSKESCKFVRLELFRLAFLTDLFGTIEMIVLDVTEKRLATILNYTHPCPFIQPCKVGFHGTRSTIRHGYHISMIGPD
jgi:hypothetical protein